MSIKNMEEYGKSYTKQVVIILLVILLLILGIRSCEQSKDLSSANALIIATNSKLVLSKTKAGLLVGKNIALETASTRDFLQLQSKDEVINKLQSLVRDYKSKLKKEGSIGIIHTQGDIDIKVSTVIDSNNGEINFDILSPTYNSSFNLDGWVSGTTIATKDSTTIKLSFKEELDVVNGRDKTGFLGLGRGIPFSEVTLHNPYNKIKVLKTYQVKSERTKYWHLGPGVFYGVGSGFTPQAFIGAGLMWTPINF